jgi:hypothetical protein
MDHNSGKSLLIGYCKVKGGAFAGLGVYPDAPAVEFYNLLADCKANTCSGIFFARVESLENNKYPLEIFGIYSYAIVPDGADPFIFSTECGYMDSWCSRTPVDSSMAA